MHYFQTQADYMREFVDHAAELLDGLLARENIADDAKCVECLIMRGRWRCRDCTSPQLLCRKCMRATHRDNGLHRIECWTGKFFRPAQLWEVGSYIFIPHCSGRRKCDALSLHVQSLATFQQPKDDAEQTCNIRPEEETPDFDSWESFECNEMGGDEDMDIDSGEGILRGGAAAGLSQHYQPARDDTEVSLHEERLQRLYGLGLGCSAEEVIEDHNVMEEDITPENGTPAAAADHDVPMPSAGYLPRRDGMDNAYVRIVHTNGIHYIPLVICSCRGVANRDMDLMYAQFVPTSFKRYRTLFTSAVLDDFRITNLECKASAFQYWQKISRSTAAATSVADVDNFVRELRRLSRCWRWLKKLKWAGFGHKEGPLMDCQPGELAIFCPACPQPGVNLSSNWQEDANQ